MDYIYILNYGDYFARLTAKKIKILGGRPRIINFNTPFADLKKPAGFIVSGSPNGSIRVPVRLLTKELFSSNLPVMGICIGAHLVTRYFGGSYRRLKKRAENGMVEMTVHNRNKLMQGLKKKEMVFMMHEDSITDPGIDFKTRASTEKCPIAATSHIKWRWYTFQFHPELSGEVGEKIFKNFIDLCYHDLPKATPKQVEVNIKLQNKSYIYPKQD